MRISYRHLPHIYAIGAPLFITFRLHNSLPAGRVFPAHLPSGKAFVCMDWLLDEERAGPTYLRIPAVARLVTNAIRSGVPSDYQVHAWVVMPNHVHVLLTFRTDPSAALRQLKGASAREANQVLGLTGQRFWQEESYDRLVRSPEEFERIERYILRNPVKAGLARSPEAYRWSSVFEPRAG